MGGPAGEHPPESIGTVNCEQCRAEMSTEGLLSRLRCAECRQIRFDRFCKVALKVGLVLSIGCLLGNLLARRSRITAPSRHAGDLPRVA
jgi:hypothetical protein